MSTGCFRTGCGPGTMLDASHPVFTSRLQSLLDLGLAALPYFIDGETKACRGDSFQGHTEYTAPTVTDTAVQQAYKPRSPQCITGQVQEAVRLRVGSGPAQVSTEVTHRSSYYLSRSSRGKGSQPDCPLTTASRSTNRFTTFFLRPRSPTPF